MGWCFKPPNLDLSPTEPGVSKNAGLVVVPRYFTASAVGRVLKKVSKLSGGADSQCSGAPSKFPVSFLSGFMVVDFRR